jgi:transcriptional regulator with XRE-family HTH domain
MPTRLRQERQARGLTQELLGAALGGYTGSEVCRWETRSRAPRPAVRKRLETLLGLSWSELCAPAVVASRRNES